MKNIGKLLSINIGKHKNKDKIPYDNCFVKKNMGIVGDIHFGSLKRQISILIINKLTEKSKLNYGKFEENLTIFSEYNNFKIKDKIIISDVILEIEQIGEACRSECRMKKKNIYCPMKDNAIYVKVLKSGKIKVNSQVKIH